MGFKYKILPWTEKTNKSRHRIIGLQKEEGQWITDEVQGEGEVAVEYFEDLFKYSSPSDFESFLQDILTSITSQINTRLAAVATEEEARQALFMMIPKASKFRWYYNPFFSTCLAYN